MGGASPLRARRRARDRHQVVRRLRDDGVVGRHLAQRGLRELDGAQDHRRSSSRRGTTSSASSTRATRALDADSLVSARQIRQPIDEARRHPQRVRRHHLRQGRDACSTCSRPTSAPTMFQRGVREYLKAHAYGNATSTDFVAGDQRGGGQGPRARVRDVPRSGRRAGGHRRRSTCDKGKPRASSSRSSATSPPGSPEPPATHAVDRAGVRRVRAAAASAPRPARCSTQQTGTIALADEDVSALGDAERRTVAATTARATRRRRRPRCATRRGRC